MRLCLHQCALRVCTLFVWFSVRFVCYCNICYACHRVPIDIFPGERARAAHPAVVNRRTAAPAAAVRDAVMRFVADARPRNETPSPAHDD